MGLLGLKVTCAVAFLLLVCTGCMARLSSTFYDSTCPDALSTIRTSIQLAVSRERRMAASLIRLHFHDCFVQGCDASVLLEDSDTIISERHAPRNRYSLRGFEVIEDAKMEVEKICPGIVSCADILAVAARDASVAVGGPTWTVKLGRRDSTTASACQAQTNLPSFISPLQTLIHQFATKGLSTRDFVALSGSHTIGQARCVTFHDRVNNNTSDIDAGFASTRRRQCLTDVTKKNTTLAPLDLVTPNKLDNNYFKNLLQKKGLLASDQILFSGGSTDSIVIKYSKSPSKFSSDFAKAMVKMGDIKPLTGCSGQIRKVCKAVN